MHKRNYPNGQIVSIIVVIGEGDNRLCHNDLREEQTMWLVVEWSDIQHCYQCETMADAEKVAAQCQEAMRDEPEIFAVTIAKVKKEVKRCGL